MKTVLATLLLLTPSYAHAWGLTSCIDLAIDDCSASWQVLQQHAENWGDKWLVFDRAQCTQAAVTVCMEKAMRLRKYGRGAKEPQDKAHCFLSPTGEVCPEESKP